LTKLLADLSGLNLQSNVSNGPISLLWMFWKANTGSGYFTSGTSANVSYTMIDVKNLGDEIYYLKVSGEKSVRVTKFIKIQ